LSSLFESTYNPDVLSCIANLSNDEVFTPPEIANQMLDLLPSEIWNDPNATFLDPACKSGVFLREIAKRLIDGLENEYPNLDERLDHIYRKQIFGIAITELTSLLSRRSLYCSKYPNSRYSVVRFDDPEGNVRFKNVRHTWNDGRCVYCGATEKEYDRDKSLEQYAYEFIHVDNPKEVISMKFDVIIGNPPYQLSDGGAQKSASPIYQKFIEQAIKLNPRYLAMIVPARWYSGGKGLDSFREKMLADQKISVIHDFPETSDCFPGVNIRGGVCYFLWDREHRGDCHVINHKDGAILDESYRPLREKGSSTFIRYNKAIEIMHKVRAFGEPTMDALVSARKPFGLATNFDDFQDTPTEAAPIELYRFRRNGWVGRSSIEKNAEWIDCWKIFEPYASPGQDDYPHLILSKPIVAGPGKACTETYLVIGPFEDERTTINVAGYMRTQFFRFMLLLLKSTQHITKKVYAYVPQQDFSQEWTDEKLYAKYGITAEESAFIDTLIKPLGED
jgi:site-specific DNA-methyltransferase (adenine-specific)